MFITLFLKNSTKYYSIPSAALYMYLGSKKGKIPYGLATFCIRSNDIYPHFIHFIVIIAINIEPPYLPVRCTSIPVMYGIIGM